MRNTQASKWRHKVDKDRAATMAVEAIMAEEKEIQLVEAIRLVIRVQISLGKSNKWWSKRNTKAVAKRATDLMRVIRLWREPDTRHTTMHLHQGWDLGHWIRMINV